MGAWISYGLGRLSDNLPSFVVMPDPRGLPYNNMGNFSSGFLPVAHAGNDHQAHRADADRRSVSARRREIHHPSRAKPTGLELLNQLNREHAAENPGDSRLDARIASATNWRQRCSSARRKCWTLPASRPRPQQLYGLDDKPSRGVRPAMPGRPADAGARRALRADLERRRRPDEQLGQPRQHQKELAADGRRDGQAGRRPAAAT